MKFFPWWLIRPRRKPTFEKKKKTPKKQTKKVSLPASTLFSLPAPTLVNIFKKSSFIFPLNRCYCIYTEKKFKNR